MARGTKKQTKQHLQRGLNQKEKKFLHLKEFSQGKPNELSLNVLEQKATEADLSSHPKHLRIWARRKGTTENSVSTGTSVVSDLNESSSEAPRGETSDQPTPLTNNSRRSESRTVFASSVTSQPFLGADSQAEITARQKRRKRYRHISIAIVVVLCCIGIGVGGYWLYQEQQRLSTSVGVLREACNIISESDEQVVAIDSYFQTSFNDDTVSTATELQESLPDILTSLDQARYYAQRADSELEASQRDKEAAEHVLATIASRETMVDIADQRLSDDIAAKQALDALSQAQSALDEGNTLLAQSAQIISDTTEEHVTQSTEYTTSAKANFEEAREYVQQAQEYYSSADFSTLLEYIDKKDEAATEALSSNAAIVIQDKTTAEAHNDAYNAADAAATALAQYLPQDLSDLVIDAYAANQDPLVQSYEQARAEAATHDAFLREYLGTSE